MSEPYREAAGMYWQAGWRGVLPIPARSKQLKLRGWTGHEGATPSYADVQAWADGNEGAGNIALRMPDGVLGIDCDAYGDKAGAATLAARVDEWGPLPATWRSSARPAPSGIYLYRTPTGLAWPGEIGRNVELVQFAHRYAVVWPSFNPDAQASYAWYGPNGDAMPYVVPTLDELPQLPQRWVDSLSSGLYTPDQKQAGVTDARTAEWLDAHQRDGTCRTVRHAQTQIASRFRHGSRHEVLTSGLLALVRLAEQGHRDIAAALNNTYEAFEIAANDAARGAERSTTQLAGEWSRALTGAVAIVLAQPTRSDLEPGCLCDTPVSALLPPPDVDDGKPRAPERIEPCPPVPNVDRDASLFGPTQADTPTVSTALTASDGYPSNQAPEPTPAPPSMTMLALEVQRQRIQREARQILDLEEAQAGFTWPDSLFSLTEELDIPDEPVLYTVQHVMPTGTNVLLAAQYKAGKTTMMNNLARSIADGSPFLGRFNIADIDGRVALWNYEVDRPMFRRWLRDMKIINTERVTPFNLRGFRMPLLVKTVEDQVVEWLKRHEIAFWVVDPFARAFVGSGDENSNNDVGRFLDTLDVIKRRAGIRDMVLPTHTGRSEMAEGAERARGATRLDDWADVRWLLTKDKEGSSYFRATGRDVDWTETQLAYDAPTRTLSMGDKSRSDLRSDQYMTAVCAVVRRSPGIGTRALRDEVKELLGTLSVESFDRARGALKRAGKMRVEQVGAAMTHYLTAPDEM